jgi:hypothetical protein
MNMHLQYLAHYSPVFEKMFFEEFREKNESEITLEDVKMDEFTELLHTIYPTQLQITGNVYFSLCEINLKFFSCKR